MPNWLLKSAVQRAISFLPQSHRWNELLQEKITKSIELTDARFEQRLRHARRHLDQFFEFRLKHSEDFSVLELGTGWYPTVPIAFYLCGASEIWTIDIVSHLNPERIQKALEMFVRFEAIGKLKEIFPWLLPERIEKLKQIVRGPAERNGGSLLASLNIQTLVRDAQQTGLAPASIDFFVSGSVLQYIPEPVLANMLREFGRVARPNAIQSHYIDLSDEYAHFDSSITQFNFLKYSDLKWGFFDSPFTRKPRLRISDFRHLFEAAGCKILREENETGNVVELKSISLAPRFQKYSEADLLVLKSWITARCAATS